MEFFAAGTEPTEYCDHHVSATICTKSGMLANEYCPKKLRQTGVYIVGGSSNTEDEPYLLSGDLQEEKYCTIHSIKTRLPKIPQIPGLKNMEEDNETTDEEGQEHETDDNGNREDNENGTDEERPGEGAEGNSEENHGAD